jgi:hypothetical protein
MPVPVPEKYGLYEKMEPLAQLIAAPWLFARQFIFTLNWM